jgi:hypothetical protein
MYHDYEEEKRSELIDKTLQAMAHLTQLMLKARKESDLADKIVPISTVLASGDAYMINCAVPRIDELRFCMDGVRECIESFEVELKVVNSRVQDLAIENAKREHNQRRYGNALPDWNLVAAKFCDLHIKKP